MEEILLESLRGIHLSFNNLLRVQYWCVITKFRSASPGHFAITTLCILWNMMVALLWIFYLIICRLSPDDIKHVRVHLSNKTAALATSAANMAPLSTAAIIWWKYHLKISSPIKAITFLCQEHTSKMHESVEYTQDILSYYWQVGVDRRNCSIFFFIPSMIRNRNKSRSCQIFQDLEYSANFQIKWRKLWILANTFTHYWMILRKCQHMAWLLSPASLTIC